MKRAIFAAVLAGATLSAAAPALAEWPADQPIRVLVGFGAGGGTDIVTRIIAEPLAELLHQSVVVENKAGAGGTIAAETVARANKDGYTALMISPAHTVSAVMLKSIRYDAVKDFADVALVADSLLRGRRPKGFPGQRHQGLGGAGQGLARQAQFCRRRRRLDAELCRRIVAPDDRHRRQAHSLSQHAGRGHGFAPGRGRLRRSSWRTRCGARCRPGN